ncbi:hypothetical protein IPO96_01320 [Candidatus Saccharibacteria bacterium]|nr:MAG: hypothetical protein IPO96_01320 [Candidatus Saccharibacteria bacterium]
MSASNRSNELSRSPEMGAMPMAEVSKSKKPKGLLLRAGMVLTPILGVPTAQAIAQEAPQVLQPEKRVEGCVQTTDEYGGIILVCTSTTRPRTSTTKPRTTTTKPQGGGNNGGGNNGGNGGGSNNGNSSGGTTKSTKKNSANTTTTTQAPTFEERVAELCAGQQGEPELAKSLFTKMYHRNKEGDVVKVDGSPEAVAIAKRCDLKFIEPASDKEGIDTNYGQMFRFTGIEDELNSSQAGALDAYARAKWDEAHPAPVQNGLKANISVDPYSDANLYPVRAGAISRINAREM